MRNGVFFYPLGPTTCAKLVYNIMWRTAGQEHAADRSTTVSDHGSAGRRAHLKLDNGRLWQNAFS